MSKILFATSEAHPLIKTGGLADVSGSLPAALKSLNHAVRLILPAYPAAKEKAGPLKCITTIRLPGSQEEIKILEGRLPGSRVFVWLVDYPPAFAREGNPYLDPDGHDWPDNPERFTLFCRIVNEIAMGRVGLNWRPDIVHCNDWQTALVPALLSLEAERPATVFTIHNLAYQGMFPAEVFFRLGLPPQLWHFEGLEFHNHLSFIKGGLAYADKLTTVSPTYAREIQSAEFGYGLDGLLRHRAADLHGILNGIDLDEWNPATDPHIEWHYNAKRFSAKQHNKRALQAEFGLPESDDLLLGSVGRLVEQKGVDLVLDIIDRLAELPVQLALLGSGEAHFEAALQDAAARHPHMLSIKLGYSERLAHRVEAGADAFLMPSRFEPCGLNQMYSLAYGTVPIVHRTGGLADTIVDLNETTARDYSATGFSFDDETSEAVLDTCLRALSYFHASRINWWKLVITGMKKDFSWPASAAQYLELYRRMCGSEDSTRENPALDSLPHNAMLPDTAPQGTRRH